MALLIDKQAFNVNGTREFGPVNVPDGLSEITIKIARRTSNDETIWPDKATKLSAEILISLDGGTNYTMLCGFTSDGDRNLTPSGTASPQTSVKIDLPKGMDRKAKARLAITGGPLKSNLTIEVT